ncbi:3-dehydroquinate synthase [Saccharothrix coeruleofusca]|uniref:3-dehydroquinate synthase n=1 Tax=Saccharothrix coeruleofusca TaxID=33919 RepID=A0A918ALV9_9PSEU|nr:3-dehydroquinate synthase [Saccharothrix coeruleofusca]MBP2336084.1 3-dehydroquinate synthase [Saccharothrix coeruleofusca]GGP55520.1 3-dehydroquinate synthase [Saccharothrix coeruleofusca]
MDRHGYQIRDHIPLPTSLGPVRVDVTRDDSYDIRVVPDVDSAVAALLDELDGHRAAVVTDHVVADLHAERFTTALAERGLLLGTTTVQAGEKSKSLTTAFELIDWLAELDFARRDVVVALGGGVVVDTVGFVASAYMRGVPYVNVPTTLLAQVDAGIGGKVAVDHSEAKNLVGAFYQPRAVISCLAHLRTLDERQVRSGLAEVVKKAVIASPPLFDFIERCADELLACASPAIDVLVHAAGAIKTQLVGRDPYEVDLRRPLNFGHTTGHAVETVTGYGPVLHGEAVAFGMAVAVDVARGRGLIVPEVADRVIGLIRRLRLPVALHELAQQPAVDDVLAAMGKIRQIRDGSLRFVLPVELGTTIIAEDVTEDEVRRALVRDRAATP